MAALHCLSCEHANSAAAKYCAQCGSALNLRLCEKCEAINQRSALRCHNCDAPLAAPGAPRRRRALIAIASTCAVGALCVGLAYYLLDRAPPQRTEKGSGPISEKRVLTPFPLEAAAERIEAATPAPEPAVRAKAAARTITHTRAAPAPAPAAPPAAAPAVLPIPAFENTAPPVTHTRRAVVAPDTKTGSN